MQQLLFTLQQDLVMSMLSTVSAVGAKVLDGYLVWGLRQDEQDLQDTKSGHRW